jgi:hypothetical protein
MRHLKNLLLARPYFTRIPASDAVRQQPADPLHHIAATRDGQPGRPDATYLLAYTPIRQALQLDTSMLNARRLRLSWFDPRTGLARAWKQQENSGSLPLTPSDYPGTESDWVLAVDTGV